MDEIKKKIEEIFKKVTTDKEFAKLFKKDPVTAVENVLGIDLPNETIDNIIDGVKAKLTVDNAKSMIDTAMNFLGKDKKK